MNRIVLSQIVKNEEHVILNSLNSGIKDICDMVVYVDTGSTDNTRELILNWGKENNIPAFVFDRPFDNFENSRNYALDMAKKMVDEQGWDRNDTWTMWADADEIVVIDKKVFNKQKMDKDLYMVNVSINRMTYTRNTFARCSKKLKWYGPVHEFITPDEPNITSGILDGYTVDVKMTGASWKGDIGTKYLKHAHIFEEYLTTNADPRWIFYCAQSWHDSATTISKTENEERLTRAKNYYQKRVDRIDGYEEERFYAQFRIGTIMNALEMPWAETMQALIKAYAMDNLRAEPIMVIIDHYLSVQEPHMAYIYSKFAKSKLHANNPYGTRLLFIDSNTYNWRILEKHAIICKQCHFDAEGNEAYKELINILRSNPNWFSPEEVQKIQINAQWFK